MRSSMAVMSTEAMGLDWEMRRLEMDMRLLDIEDWEERPETTEADGEMDRGVLMSELEVLKAYDAIGTIACAKGPRGDERSEKRTGDQAEAARNCSLASNGWMSRPSAGLLGGGRGGGVP